MSEISIIVSGFGGQGVLSAGKIIAMSGMLEGKEVSWLPSYGPEMRGGTANCSVIISDDAIGSPLLNECDVLIALNKPSMEKFSKVVKPGGSIIFDSSLASRSLSRTDIKEISVPASAIASEMGNMTYAGIILLGVLSYSKKCFKKESFEKALYKILPENKHKLIPEEIKAFERAEKYTKKRK